MSFLKKTRTFLATSFIFSCLILPFSLTTPAFSAQTIHVGVYESAPMIFTDADRTVKGIYSDILRDIAKNEDWDIKYVHGSFAECLEKLDQGIIDIMPAIAWSEERSHKYDYSEETLLINWGQVFIPMKSVITNITDLQGATIAVVREDIYYQGFFKLLESFNISADPVFVNDYPDVLALLNDNRADAGIVSRIYGDKQSHNFNVKRTAILFSPIHLRFAFPKNRGEAFAPILDRHIRAMQKDSSSIYFKSLDHWLHDDTSVGMPSWVIPALLVTLALLLFFTLTTLFLKRQVRLRTLALENQNIELAKEIEERRKAEETVEIARKEWERTFNSVPDLIAIIDLGYTVLRANRATADFFGMTTGDIVGRKCYSLFHDTTSPFAGCLHKKVIESGMIHWMEFQPSNTDRTFHTTIIPWNDSAGNICGTIHVARDITDLKEAQRRERDMETRAMQAQKMESLGILAGGIAHDFNNFLVAIMGNADLALTSVDPDHRAYNHLSDILQASERASELANQMLAYSGKAQFITASIQLNDLVLKMGDLLRVSVGPNCDIHYRLDNHLPCMRGDPVQIGQIIMNLVVNASEAMAEKSGVITISTSLCDAPGKMIIRDHFQQAPQSGAYVHLQVADQGMGISPEVLSHLFEPFFTTKFAGRGLGLSVVLGILRGHSGFIGVESVPGRGSTFHVYFPADISAPPAPEPPSPPDSISEPALSEDIRSKNVLIIDDEPNVLKTTSAMLRHGGFGVLTAQSGEEALALIRERAGDIHMVLLDLTMPDMDGRETLLSIREMSPSLPVVLSSGYDEQDTLKHFPEGSMSGFLKKPYRIAELIGAVRRALADNPPR